MTDRNCLSYWFPRLQATGVPVPATRWLTTDVELDELVDGKAPHGFNDLVRQLELFAGEVGGYPVFLRTGHGSGKHEWKRTCFVRRRFDIAQHVVALVEWSHVVDMFGLPTSTWAVREMLPTQVGFHAFDGNMPITVERRYFVNEGRVVGHHPYWPPDAIENASTGDFELILDRMSVESADEVDELTALSEVAAAAFDGSWSIDWLWTVDRGWVCIDMADAWDSFRWSAYPSAPSDADLRAA